ncbi:winged helix-turn-helix domain-containing protein [Alteromonas aestuariivivens]|nr:winged helix-turn-helix domain-containing protein [Alteromonas aestuariivivens]
MLGNTQSQIPLLRILAIYAGVSLLVLELLPIFSRFFPAPSTNITLWAKITLLAFLPVVVGIFGARTLKRRTLPTVESSTNVATLFQIGSASVDINKRQIRFNNKPAEVQPKIFDLLVYLLKQRHRVVPKEELLDEVWPDVVVSESSLTQSIKRLRDLFRQQGVEQDIVRTVSRKGYQWDHPVKESAHQPRPSAPFWITLATPVLTTAVPAALMVVLMLYQHNQNRPLQPAQDTDYSLAVLPFSNFTGEGEFQYFSDGLTETVTDSLTRVKNLKIIAPHSVFSAVEAQQDFLNVGQELGVSHLIIGSVQRDGDEVRISARLVDVVNGQQLWSQMFQRPFDGIFMIHDEIARSIMHQLGSLFHISIPSLALPTEQHDSFDSEAYRLVLKGNELRRNGDQNGRVQAISVYREALTIRPDYPQAMVALADTLRTQSILGEIPRQAGFAEAITLIQRALRINPEDGEAYVQLADIQHRHFWDFENAQSSFEQALNLTPGSAAAHSAYSRFLSKAGQYNEAVNEARIARELDPLSRSSASSLAIRLIRARELEEARKCIDDFKQHHPQNANIPWLEANWHIRFGDYTEALQWSAQEELAYLRLSLNAIALHLLGRTEQASQQLNELIATDASGAAFQIAEVYAQWGQVDDAFAWLERAFSQGDPGLSELYSSVNLENLYTDPRFESLATRIGLPPMPLSITKKSK